MLPDADTDPTPGAPREPVIQGLDIDYLKPAPPPPHIRRALLYFDKDYIAVMTSAGYARYRADPSTYAVILAADVGDVELGQAVTQALASSRFLGLDQLGAFMDLQVSARDIDAWVAQMLEATGRSSRRALYKTMRSLTVSRSADALQIEPSERLRAELWQLLKDQRFSIPLDSDAQTLGAAVRVGMARCT